MTTSIPKLSNGLRYAWGADNERICIGASMGRGNALPDDVDAPVKLNLRKLRLVDDACYDSGGAYWGQGDPLYRATGEDAENQVEIFMRGKTRAQAKASIKRIVPGARFYR